MTITGQEVRQHYSTRREVELGQIGCALLSMHHVPILVRILVPIMLGPILVPLVQKRVPCGRGIGSNSRSEQWMGTL